MPIVTFRHASVEVSYQLTHIGYSANVLLESVLSFAIGSSGVGWKRQICHKVFLEAFWTEIWKVRGPKYGLWRGSEIDRVEQEYVCRPTVNEGALAAETAW